MSNCTLSHAEYAQSLKNALESQMDSQELQHYHEKFMNVQT